MDKIIFIMINIKDLNGMIIIQSMIHKTGQDFSSIYKDPSTTGLMDPGFTIILSLKCGFRSLDVLAVLHHIFT